MKRTTFTALPLVLLTTTLLLAFQAAPSNAPSSSETPLPKFKSQSRLVVVPAVVLRHGTPLTGLRKDQFKVYQDGKEQKISGFEEIKADASRAALSPEHEAVAGTFSNIKVDGAAPKRLVIIVLDPVNTTWEDSWFARQQLIKFLSRSDDDDALISLMTIGRNGVEVIHDFTADRNVLVAAVKKLRHKGDLSSLAAGSSNASEFHGEVNALTNFFESGRVGGVSPFRLSVDVVETCVRIRQTLDALNIIAQAYAGVPGRKSLIWATGGFPFYAFGGDFVFGTGTCCTFPIGYYEQTWRLMNDANVAMYPVDARGLTVDFPDASEYIASDKVNDFVRQRSADNVSRIQVLRTFADMTGGRAFYNNNGLAEGFRKAATDAASYYMLSYYMDGAQVKEQKIRWHDLKVKVSVQGAEIRARDGFYSGQETPDAVKNEIALALTSPLDFTALPVTVRWLQHAPSEPGTAPPQKDKDTARNFEFEVSVPHNSIAIDESDGNRMSMEVITAARSEQGKDIDGIVQKIDGKMKKSVEQIRRNGWLYKGSISLPPGSYSVRFVVRDHVGQRTGSVVAPLAAN